MHTDISVTKLYLEGPMEDGYESKLTLVRQLRALAERHDEQAQLLYKKTLKLRNARKLLQAIVDQGLAQMDLDKQQHAVEISKRMIRKGEKLLKKL